MKKILLRADDLGYSEAINYGIEKAVKEGLIRSVGVMVNMPASKHGVDLLVDEPIAFGQHTNFCVGRPISDPKLIPSLVDEEGMFKTSTVYRKAEEDFVNYDEALIEIEAQYNQFLMLFNKKPDYFEGHAVASANFFRALEDFAHKNELKYSGLPEGKDPNRLDEDSHILINEHKVYMTMESMNEDYDPYDTFYKMVKEQREDGVEMMIFHPGYLDDYIINHSSLLLPRTKEVTFLTNPEISNFLIDKEIDCLDYRDL
ncbi:ChbG/HpnK family deacetylase [Tetragenococcus koreensis]|uniref:PTS sugar transporter n=1 Tax=Tetragenococcus koreensis TaxID=290335 RepID=A0AAN4UBA4_9ENTE|nr:ChbG/HpnK family deacetylase [Tetragenococcus koreensis]MCF1616302.1 ChbG/HpnK family deacetylase [Tetragenococcus koreensis]MCF1621215.1 ChbG/HpnK family deacetylase [Tetragenococcus koreensis]MCF1626173.1 ChbG/HpnK family deacetylase [Tetragenococcus koreensis]MCF1631209.1 ChbG/HpnK family deacetylase [Tetragenococcus koreensis]MCF1677264.1 ChbG/HpnK family deacetylase [Tetragenococcus koreensis]